MWRSALVLLVACHSQPRPPRDEPALRRELLDMMAEDQRVRFAWIEKSKRGEKPPTTDMEAIDAKNLAELHRIVARSGWPTVSMVGSEGAHAAWLMLQHADKDLAFQKQVLAQLKQLAATGEASPTDYAYLEDRVAVNEHRKQTFGTQFDEHQEPQPIEDAANVDARRRSVGLGTMAEYRAQMRRMYGERATPASSQFDAWLAAFDQGDRAALVAYHAQQFPYDVASDDVKGIDREAQLRDATGGFEVKLTERPSPTQIVVTMKEKHSEQFARATMEVDPSEPHRVTKFEIHPIPTPPALLSPELAALHRMDATRRRAVVEAIARELDAHYVAPDVGTKMIAAMRDHLAHGDYDAIAQAPDFAAALTRDLREISRDKHLAVDFMPRPPGAAPPPPDPHDFAKRVGYGVGAIERMPDNIARVELRGFPPILDDEARAALGERMSTFADADAVIFDLRNNGGGSPDTVALSLSYVFDKPTHINSMYSRDTGKTEASWTLADVKGKRFGGKKPVFVVTSNRTFSGGEEFTYDLQAQRRATIVGEVTGGGAHPVAGHDLGDGFSVRVPMGRPINPITKTDWEGTGVVPDVAVAADAALARAHELAVAAVRRRKR